MSTPSRIPIDWYITSIVAGVVLLLLGLQLRLVEGYVCTPKTTTVLVDWFGPTKETPRGAVQAMLAEKTSHRHIVEPPKWSGWAALAVGAVLLANGAMGKWRK